MIRRPEVRPGSEFFDSRHARAIEAADLGLVEKLGPIKLRPWFRAVGNFRLHFSRIAGKLARTELELASALMQRAISTNIISAVITALAGAAHAAPLPQIGVVVTMDIEYFGCQSVDDLARVVNLDWVHNDKRSAIAFGRQHCIGLAMGDQFKVQGVSVVHGAVCLQPPGSDTCYWTNAQNLKGP